MTRPSSTQAFLLRRAATRPGNLVLPLPDNLHGSIADRVLRALLAKGLIEEVEANTRRREPIWRETGAGHGTTLIATEAGLAAVGIEPLVAGAIANARQGRMARDAAVPVAPPAVASSARTGTKQAALIALLQRPEGASITEAAGALEWQGHTVRGAISGVLKKRLGLIVNSEKIDGRGTVYRIATGG
ncbi:Protein of unknown function [Paracoccus thiocyanatus]|uniref:DUF3489 domain-containing protein n=1 Tax=Paracoccus thiocyanatus TaxID=34006 RepID=A0A1N6Y304_9RHOB|nr:DUF3489 domain-containing protein [Paracoccus thiocyanatus]SIR08914.1 Protein of unknown function [Paracoccus thiocyanatus]